MIDKLNPGTTGRESHTRIAVTEWGIIVGGNDWRQSPNHPWQVTLPPHALVVFTFRRP